MHIVHKDGSTCYGREQSIDVTVQRYVLMGKDAGSLGDVLADKKLPGLLEDGYIITQVRCKHTVLTTADGCKIIDANDAARWEKIKETPAARPTAPLGEN